MKNIDKILLVVLFNFFFLSTKGQEITPVMRYVYEVNFPLPTTDTISNRILTEVAYLDVDQNQSRFASAGRISKDEESLAYNTGSNAQDSEVDFIAALKANSTKLDFMVFRQDKELSTYLKSGMDFYQVQEPVELIKWQIHPDIEHYYGMEVQKATGSYANRTWEVWFTQEIPLIEGPYKFKNLPGFVVKAVDSTNEWRFELVEADLGTTTYWVPLHGERAMKISKKQWLKIKKNNAKKSIGQFLEQNSAQNQVRIFDFNGKEATQDFLNHKLKENIKALELD